MKQTLLTGLQPSGDLHVGNYFGALKPFADEYRKHDSYLMIADLHALTTVRDAALLRRQVMEVVKDYVAAGVDPRKCVIFRQSDVPAHAELAWIFDCLVSVKFLELGHAYKDKVAKGLEANAGLFTYPMLMAADILLYGTDLVPVGEDQRQHVEYAREAAAKFNLAYGPLFKEPKEMILKGVGVVPGTDGKKMSKSYGNVIPLFASREKVEKAVMGIVTDSSGSRPENVFAIHKLVRPEAELEAVYREHQGQYKKLKEMLAADLEAYFGPMREKRARITDAEVKRILARGAAKARKASGRMMERAKKAAGLR